MNQKEKKNKGLLAFFRSMIEKLDRKMEEKAKKGTCCDKDKQEGKPGSCCN